MFQAYGTKYSYPKIWMWTYDLSKICHWIVIFIVMEIETPVPKWLNFPEFDKTNVTVI